MAAPVEKINTVEDFDNLFKKYANQNALDWKFLKTISMNESTLGQNPRVRKGISNPKDIEGSKSSDGLSWGIMQMTVTTARDYDKLATSEKLNNPEYSIRLSSLFIASLKRQFGGKWRDMAMAYNHGTGNQRKFLELEKNGKLQSSQFLAGREYWTKFKRNYSLIFGENLA